MSKLQDQKCCGQPFTWDGELRQGVMNDCPFPPKYCCIGLTARPDGGPATLLVLACSLHHSSVMDLLYEMDPESADSVPIDALPMLLDELGPDVWTINTEAA